MPRRGGSAPGAGRLVVELLDRRQHVDERPLLLRRHGRRGELRQRLRDQLLSLFAAEHLAADGFHHMLRQDAAHHRHLDAAGRVVDDVERRFLAGAEEGIAGGVAEALRDDHGGARPAALHRVSGAGFVRSGQPEVLVGIGGSDDRLRDRARIVIDDRHGDARRLGVVSRAGKDRAEERCNRDRHDEADDHRPPIAEEQLQILAHHRGERDEGHQSRRLLPVSVRNTASSVARPPPTPATRDCSPASVSSAITRP